MTDQEIVQALRQCAKSDCSSCGMCPIFPDRECVEHLAAADASLIERMTAENVVLPDGQASAIESLRKEIDWKQSRDSTLNVLINGPTSNGFGKDIFRKMARDLYGRLKAYEDTGLEPEAVETVKLALAAKHLVDLETLNNTPISRLVELAEADKDGCVIILPCKVYETDGVRVYEHTVREVIYETAGGPAFDKNAIGKSIFLTREEAERASREMEGKKDG